MIFSTTCHETAHTTHWQVMNFGLIQYSQVDAKIYESWAVAVEWFITQMEYRERGIDNYSGPTYNILASYPIRYGYQYWPIDSNLDYSSVFIDMVDNFNQRGQTFPGINGTVSVNDPVTGYTFTGIESGFLKHVYGLSSLRENLKSHKPAGVTDAQIDLLMNSF